MNKIKNKHIFSISFIAYPCVIYCTENIENNLLELFSYILLIFAIIYELAFIIKLRKKDDLTLGRSIFMSFVRFFQFCSLFAITHLINIYFFGIKVYTIALPQSRYVGTFYGFEAWEHDLFAIIVAPIVFFITFVLTIIWLSTKKKI